MRTETLHTKYRPDKWEAVLGQATAVKSIRQSIKGGTTQSFLLTGPSGCGKTTIARLIGRTMGVEAGGPGWIEYDAATNTGVDAVRTLCQQIRLKPLGARTNVVCMDECHMLTKAAWNALLKDVEEPPGGTVWIFCTTEPTKVPQTIVTRCATHKLRPVPQSDVFDLLTRVAKEEGLDVDAGIIDMVVEAAGGSPRAALVGLGKVANLTDDEDIRATLEMIDIESAEIADLCRALMNGTTYAAACAIVKDLDMSAESIRQIVVAWFGKMVFTAKHPQKILAILAAFRDPYPPVSNNNKYPVALSLGELLL